MNKEEFADKQMFCNQDFSNNPENAKSSIIIFQHK